MVECLVVVTVVIVLLLMVARRFYDSYKMENEKR